MGGLIFLIIIVNRGTVDFSPQLEESPLLMATDEDSKNQEIQVAHRSSVDLLRIPFYSLVRSGPTIRLFQGNART